MIPHDVRKNFDMLNKAFQNNDVCLVESTRVSDGKAVYLLCAVNNRGVEGVDMVPFAEMCSVNPYEAYHHPVYAMEKEEHLTELEIPEDK